MQASKAKAQYHKPLDYTSFGGWGSPWGLYFWNDISHWVIGLQFYPNYAAEISGYRFRWGIPGWCYDAYTFWHRGRFGWAPRDTWSLDTHLNHVLAGTLEHLAYHSHGVPAGYGFPGGAAEEAAMEASVQVQAGVQHMPEDLTVDARFLQWQAKLLEWAKAFSEDPQDVDIYDQPDYTTHHAEEERRRNALHKALKEMEPWWEMLWD